MKPPKGENPFMLFLKKLVQLFHVLLVLSSTFCFVLYFISPNDTGATDNVFSLIILIYIFNTILDLFGFHPTLCDHL